MTDQAKRTAQGPRKYFQLDVDFSVSSKAPGHQWLNEAEQMTDSIRIPISPFAEYSFRNRRRSGSIASADERRCLT
jgi:hypothetical protein